MNTRNIVRNNLRKRERVIDRRLRSQVGQAWTQPSSGLRGRTLATLAATPVGVGSRSRETWRFPGALAAAASFLLLVAGLAAVTGVVERAPAPSRMAVNSLPIVIGLGPGRLETALDDRANQTSAAWQRPLIAEARFLLADARHATEVVLARLPGRPVRVERVTPEPLTAPATFH